MGSPIRREFPADAGEEIPSFFDAGTSQKCRVSGCVQPPHFLVFQFPEMSVIKLMLKNLLSASKKEQSYLFKIYDILSSHFSHFSTAVYPWKEARGMFSVGDKRLNLLSYNGLVFSYGCLFVVVKEYLDVRNSFLNEN